MGSHQRGFAQPGLWGAARTSVESASLTTALVAATGIPLAHWLAARRSPLRAAVGLAVQLPLALPPVMAGVVLLYLVGPYTRLGQLFAERLTGSLAGIVLAQVFVAAPFLVIAARSAFGALDPALDDLGATLGLGAFARFRRIAVPAACAGIRAGLLLCWLRAFGEYGATVLVAYHPYSLPVFTSVQFSGAGIPDTQAPTALALAAAAVAVAVSRIRAPRRRPGALPAPSAPQAVRPTPVAWDLDTQVGGFHLCVAHRPHSARLAILGPSGSGKSLTLKAIAGLLGPAAGAVEVAGRQLGHLPPEARRFGYVPQGQGLLPHRTVWDQLLLAPGSSPATAAWWLQTLRIADLAGRLPGELSGGQRQRVAMAMAMAHGPAVVLLDEPFSALDAPVRDELRSELRRLQRETGLSTVLVTHDPEEAALLADELVVIAGGRVLQAGSREEVQRHPATAQVAALLGIRNVVPGAALGPDVIRAGALVVAVPGAALAPGTPVTWCVRPEHVGVGRADGGATVVDRIDTGTHVVVDVLVDDGPQLRAHLHDPTGLAVGDRCSVEIADGAVSAWPAAPPARDDRPAPP